MGGSSSGTGGGLARALSKAIGPQVGAAQPGRSVTQMQQEEGGRVRGARRRGRQLLSDARLKAESGMETLGGGDSLG